MIRDDAGDAELVRRAARGDERAFALLVRRHLRRAMAVALEFADTRDDAEDVVQETFRRVFVALRDFDATRDFEPWFYTILRNVARNAVRSSSRRAHVPLPPERASPAGGPYEAARQSEMRLRIDDAVALLPPMQAHCFRLCLVEGFTSGEAAVALGIAESTVRVHVLKARRTLQRVLETWHDEVDR